MFYFACLAGGCSPRQAQWLYLGVRLGDWATRMPQWRLPRRLELLYRLPAARNTPTEQELLNRFASAARQLKTLDDTVDFQTLETRVETVLG